MTLDEYVLTRAVLAIAVALLLCGAFAAWAAANAIKRLAAVTIALVAAVMAGAALGAPGVLLIGGAGVAFAYFAVGAALVVRAQEEYGAVETSEIDSADARDDAGPAR